MDILAGILSVAVLAGGVLALGALGEVLCERVGVVNLGVEGLMAMGAVVAIIVVLTVPNVYLALPHAIATGFVFGALFAVATVIVRANQILCGLALTLIGTGLAVDHRQALLEHARAGELRAGDHSLPERSADRRSWHLLAEHPRLRIYIILPIGLHYLLFKTRHGLNLRAVGENPAAADAAGIPVRKIRFWYVSAGGALAAAAGAYLTLAYIPSWSDGVVAGRGWIAVALVIFAGIPADHRGARRAAFRRDHGARLRRSGAQLADPRALPIDAAVSRNDRPDDRAGPRMASDAPMDGRPRSARDAPISVTSIEYDTYGAPCRQ